MPRIPIVVLILAILCGCSGPTPVEDVSLALAVITPESAKEHLEALLAGGPRPPLDSARNAEVLAYLREHLEAWGYSVYEESFDGFARTFEYVEGAIELRNVPTELTNLIAERRGSVEPDTVLEVCAHYDTLASTVGADDNTSGVVGALEIARALRTQPLAKTVRFCFFALEEEGLAGSRHHVDRILASGESLEGMINLEMIGFTNDAPNSQLSPPGVGWLIGAPTVGNFIAVVGRRASADLGRDLIATFEAVEPELEVFGLPRMGGWLPDAHRSDHAPYWWAGLPAVMLTDTADLRNPHYHQASDTLPTLDLVFLARVARGTAALLIRRAGVGAP